MTIDILVMNKHGYLLYPDYVKYEQGIYFTAIGLAILLVYFYSIYSHSKSSDGFNSISSLSKRFTFGIYLPYMLISVVRLVYYYIQNSNPSTAKAQYSNGTRVHRDSSASFLDLCEEFFHYANYHLLMLVAMGYGSIYCSNSTANKKSNGTRVLPSRLWNFALKLILVTIFVITVKHFDDKYSENLFDFLDYLSGALEVTNKHINAYYFISPVIQFVETILPLTWVSISTIYFSRTYSKIDKMKLSGKSLQGRVARSFKYSIVLIAVIPVVFGAVYMTFIVWQVSKTGREFRSNQRPSFEAYEAAILDELIMRQKMVFSRNFQIQKLWLENLYILISMVVTYFLWIKDNTGLIGDNTLYEKIPMSTSRSKSREETVYENNSE